ncbi:hypothetical protein DCS_07218 [Drechmeria coniospora]|uniref:Uncharacterized protein n=1 Tax=Drechmeria coniospora TaxID=98403 RepID=A0A151GDT5_DRECN|nr:hypothetical protein DCS_07218 [Drechmeria coniospora]KYK55255.1 hypothetical protein DCS_07218 [Drechmeria coniospora]
MAQDVARSKTRKRTRSKLDAPSRTRTCSQRARRTLLEGVEKQASIHGAAAASKRTSARRHARRKSSVCACTCTPVAAMARLSRAARPIRDLPTTAQAREGQGHEGGGMGMAMGRDGERSTRAGTECRNHWHAICQHDRRTPAPRRRQNDVAPLQHSHPRRETCL